LLARRKSLNHIIEYSMIIGVEAELTILNDEKDEIED
jgi:hypothetical protein